MRQSHSHYCCVGIYEIRMFLEFEIIPTIVVRVATIVVQQTATIVIVTIVVLIATVVIGCDIVVTSPLHMDCGLKTLFTAIAVELLGNFYNLLLFIKIMQYNN